MGGEVKSAVDTDEIRTILAPHNDKLKLSLRICAHCSLCAESCFKYHVNKKDPRYMPSHKIIHSIGKIFKKKGRVDRACLEDVREIVWGRCALCMRCYCPFGIDIPQMIALARSICRSQGVVNSLGFFFTEGENEM